MSPPEDKTVSEVVSGGKPDISVIDAGLDSLSKEVNELKKDVKDQRGENKNIIIFVLLALVLIALTVAVEVILFHSRDAKYYLDIQDKSSQEVQGVRKDNFDMELRLQKQIDDLKNPTKQTSPI